MGIDPRADVLDSHGVAASATVCSSTPTSSSSTRSRGPSSARSPAASARDGESSAEVLHRRVTVRGLFDHGHLVRHRRDRLHQRPQLLRGSSRSARRRVDIGLVRLVPGVDPRAVQAALRAHLPRDVQVLTTAEMLAHEIRYWASGTPIGFVFTFGVIMGLVVGMIIVYQILFADIADHLKEYATLKAMGYGNRYLSGVVLMQAAILAAVGFVPAVGLCTWLYAIAGRATGAADDARPGACRARLRADAGHVLGLGAPRHPQAPRRRSGGRVLMGGEVVIGVDQVSHHFGAGALRKQILFDVSAEIDGRRDRHPHRSVGLREDHAPHADGRAPRHAGGKPDGARARAPRWRARRRWPKCGGRSASSSRRTTSCRR